MSYFQKNFLHAIAGVKCVYGCSFGVLLLTFIVNIFHTFPSASIVDFEQGNISWDMYILEICSLKRDGQIS